jgi:hypothetical protein
VSTIHGEGHFNSITTEQLLAIRAELSNYTSVFSTNYDLLIYWAIMAAEDRRFDDSFRGRGVPFDAERVCQRRSYNPQIGG